MRRFPTAGPVAPADHYHLPPLSRVDRDRLLREVESEHYFVVHGPPQTGKTTTLLALRDLLNERGYRCLYASLRDTAPDDDDLDRAMAAVLDRLASEATATLGDDFLARESPGMLAKYGPESAFFAAVTDWAGSASKPLALLLDDADSLQWRCLASLRHQVRAGYEEYPRRFPRTMAIGGIRRVDSLTLGGDIPFNCISGAYRLGDFSEEEVRALLGQHTEETGQPFSPEAIEEICRATAGQPWLVNALADDACFGRPDSPDLHSAITEEAVAAARERLLSARPLPLRQVADRLREESVRRVVEPIVTGDRPSWSRDDGTYARDLGLISQDRPLRIANPIFREVLRTTSAAGSAPSRPALHR